MGLAHKEALYEEYCPFTYLYQGNTSLEIHVARSNFSVNLNTRAVND